MNHLTKGSHGSWELHTKSSAGFQASFLFFSFWLHHVKFSQLPNKEESAQYSPEKCFYFHHKSVILSLLSKADRPWGQQTRQFKFLPSLSGQPSVANCLAAVPVSWFCFVAVKPDELQGYFSCGGCFSSALCNFCSPGPQNNLEHHLSFLALSSCCLADFPPSLCPSCRMFQHVSERERWHDSWPAFFGCSLTIPSFFLTLPTHRPATPSRIEKHVSASGSQQLARVEWAGVLWCHCCAFGGLLLFPPTMFSCSCPVCVHFTNFSAQARGTRPQCTAVNECVARVCVRCLPSIKLLQPWRLTTLTLLWLVSCNNNVDKKQMQTH